MAAPEKSRLRNSLRKLRSVEASLGGDVDRLEVAQEILDLLALRAGLKPVLLLGRGLDDPRWIAGALGVARDLHLRVVEGPYWDATPFGDDVPGWYAERVFSGQAPFRAWYVCRSAETEQTVRAVAAAGGRLAVAQEARLLGYPECCVAAHYERALAFHRATLSILRRHAGGDAAGMRSLVDTAARLPAGTDAERAGLAAAATIVPAPFGSWNMCPDCAEDGDSPSAHLSRRYAALARTVDPDWAGMLATAAPPPGWTR
jgi:hypothetical protein